MQLSTKKFNLIITAVLLAILLVLLFRTCGPRNGVDGLVTIPDDITMVVSLDLPAFIKKADFEDLKKSSFFKDYMQKASVQNPVFTAVLADPLKSGVDFTKNTYYALDYDELGNNEHFASVIFSLKDVGKFESLISSSQQVQVKNATSFKYILLDKITAVGWNDHFVIFGSSDMFIGLPEKLSLFFDTKPEKSILQNAAFVKAIRSGKDLSFWLNSTSFLNDKALLRSYGVEQLPADILKDNYIIGQVEFKDGRVEGKATFEFKDELKNIFNTYFNEKSEADFLDDIPGKNCGFVFQGSLNLPGIIDYKLGDKEARAAIENLLSRQGLTLKDLYRTFGGDVFVASHRNDPLSKASLLMGVKYYNRNLLDKIFGIGIASEMLVQENRDLYKVTTMHRDSSSFSITFTDGHPRLAVMKDKFYFITDQEVYTRLINGGYQGSGGLAADKKKVLEDKLIGGFFDVDLMLNEINDPNNIFKVFNFSFDKKELNFTLDLLNKNESSLKQLIASGSKQSKQ